MKYTTPAHEFFKTRDNGFILLYHREWPKFLEDLTNIKSCRPPNQDPLDIDPVLLAGGKGFVHD